jgi:hypothetical protein
MLTEKQIYAQLHQLPEEAQREVLHYIQFLVYKQTHHLSSKPKQRVFGSVPGKYQLAVDFDAPLDDFKDYML